MKPVERQTSDEDADTERHRVATLAFGAQTVYRSSESASTLGGHVTAFSHGGRALGVFDMMCERLSTCRSSMCQRHAPARNHGGTAANVSFDLVERRDFANHARPDLEHCVTADGGGEFER